MATVPFQFKNAIPVHTNKPVCHAIVIITVFSHILEIVRAFLMNEYLGGFLIYMHCTVTHYNAIC